MSIRTVGATATDGRWAWDESGQPLPFEDVSRYGARRKRDRLDRELLVQYLAALGRRSQSLQEARLELGVADSGE